MYKKNMLIILILLSVCNSKLILAENNNNKITTKNNIMDLGSAPNEFDDLMSYDLPKPKLEENPSMVKVWSRKIGILLLEKILKAKEWLANKYNVISK